MRSKGANMKFKLLSYTKFTLEKHHSECLINFVSSLNAKFESKFNGNNLELTVLRKYKGDIIRFLSENKIEIIKISNIGFLSGLKKYNRIGLFCGTIFILISVFISSKLVWQINVEGNIELSDEDVIGMLNESGFRLGKFVPSINYDKLQNEILLKNREISWISINIDGNVASVLVKESKTETTESSYFSNIVAKRDAQILEIKVKKGERVIKINDVVKEGELLVSGIIDSQSQGVRYEKADAEIIALTNHDIFVEFPYKGKEKVYTGKTYTERKIKFFSKVINFSVKTNKNLELYDKIEEKRQIVLFGKYKLPVFLEKTRYFEYKTVDKEYSYQESVDLAFKELKIQIDGVLSDAELISKSTETSFDENGFYILCNLKCIENIAKEVRIYKN